VRTIPSDKLNPQGAFLEAEMYKFFHRRESNIQKPGSFLHSLQIFGRILLWLSGFIDLTEEEQRDAGICHGDQYSRR
jgi:hypothetical protein